MYTAEELGRFGWDAYELGEPADVVIVQADHAEYAELSLEQFPGASVVVDGRKVLDPARFGGASFLVVGQGSAEA
jgi:UDP-N-acetyl-D-mannosaminuronate dehydrogenase